MSARRYEIILRRDRQQQLSLDDLAARADVHPARVECYVECGLIEPAAGAGAEALYDASAILRLRVIERLRCDIGINLAGVAVILEMLDRLRALQGENDWLRRRL